MSGRQPKGLSTLCRALPMRTWKLEHVKRGGIVEHGLTRRVLDAAQVRTRKKVKKDKRTGAFKHRPSAYVLFLRFKCEERKKQHATDLAAQPARSIGLGKRPVRSHRFKVKVLSRGTWARWSNEDLPAIRKEWHGSSALRALWTARALTWTPPRAARPAATVGMAKPPMTPEASFWGAGDVRGPCSVDALAKAIGRHAKPLELGLTSTMSRDTRGPVSCGASIIEQEDASFMVSSKTRPGEPLPALKLKKTCWQLHPGLCIARDAPIVPMVLRMCCNMNTVFTGVDKWSMIGSVLRVILTSRGMTTAAEYTTVGHIQIAKIRQARPRVQMVSLLQHDPPGSLPDPANGQIDTLLMPLGRELFALATSYAAARSFVQKALAQGEANGEDCVLTHATLQHCHVHVPRAHGAPSELRLRLSIRPIDQQLRKGAVVEIYPTLLPKAQRQTAAWRREAAASDDPIVRSIATLVSQDARLKALTKWGKRAFTSLWGPGGGGGAFLQEQHGQLGRGRGRGRGQDAGKGRGGAKGRANGRGRGRGRGRGKGDVPDPPDEPESDADSDPEEDRPEAWEEAQFHIEVPPPAPNLPVGRRATMKFPHGTGMLVWNHTARSIDSHCWQCGLAINRTISARDGAKSIDSQAQGRPMGAQLAILKACPGTDAAHRAKYRASVLSFQVRHTERTIHRGLPRFAYLFEKERPPNNSDIDGEPRGLP